MNQKNLDSLRRKLSDAKHINIIQPENPDGDSLASSLALEEMFSELKKEVSLYCPVNIPNHLRHLPGWDRVSAELPRTFDLSIIVDTTSESLLEKSLSIEQRPLITSKPVIFIDHHDQNGDISFEALHIVDKDAVATGEVIYDLATRLKWPLSQVSRELIAAAIMYDSLGLSTEATTSKTIRIIADLVEAGVSLAHLDEQRRELMRRAPEITHYKGELLQRVELHHNGRIATIDIPWEEIERYSDQYNPSMLVLDDMRMTENVRIAIAFKTYPDGKVTAKIRANHGMPIARDLATAFDGGGHEYAAGFKAKTDDFLSLKKSAIDKALNLIENKPGI